MMFTGQIRLLSCLALLCVMMWVSPDGFSQAAGTGSVELYAEEGQKALAEGRYSDAAAAFEKLRALEPNVAEIQANLGLIYFQQGKFEQAVPVLREALRLKPSLTKTDSLLAMSLSELGRYEEALPGLEKGFHKSADPEMRRMCGLHLERAYTGLQRNDKAVAVALELNHLFPDDPEVLYHSGRIFGNYAYLSMERLTEVAPNSSWRYQAMAEAHESQGNSIAIAEYREVLKRDPNRPGIHYRLGRVLLAQAEKTHSPEDTAAAMDEFQKELALDPTNSNAAYEIGEVQRNAGEFDEAQAYFERALKAYPDFEQAQVGLAAVLIAKNQPAQALPHLQKAIAINPDDEVAWYRLSQVQRKLGNISEEQKALAEFRRLHAKTNEQKLVNPVSPPTEVTPQPLDANVQ